MNIFAMMGLGAAAGGITAGLLVFLGISMARRARWVSAFAGWFSMCPVRELIGEFFVVIWFLFCMWLLWCYAGGQ